MQVILTAVQSVAPPIPNNASATSKDYIPLLQSLVWPVFWLLICVAFRKQFADLFRILSGQIEKGASVKIGVLELTSSGVVKKTADLGNKVDTAGRPDRFELLFKAQGVSKGRFFIKSTKAMKVPGGCVIQVTSEIQNVDRSWSIAESLTFVPGNIDIKEDKDNAGNKSGRFLGSTNSSPNVE